MLSWPSGEGQDAPFSRHVGELGSRKDSEGRCRFSSVRKCRCERGTGNGQNKSKKCHETKRNYLGLLGLSCWDKIGERESMKTRLTTSTEGLGVFEGWECGEEEGRCVKSPKMHRNEKSPKFSRVKALLNV